MIKIIPKELKHFEWTEEDEVYEKPKPIEKPKPADDFNLSSPSEITKQGDVYVVSNIKLYDLDGSLYMQYPEIKLDASPVHEGDEIARKSQKKWLDFYTGKDKSLPSLPLLCAIMEAAYDNKDDDMAQELLQSLQSDFDPNYLVMSTRFNYDQNKVWHNAAAPEQIEFNVHIPGISDYLENIIKSPEWEKPLRSIFMINDIEKLPKVLGIYNDRKCHLYIPGDRRNIERAAFVGFYGGDFSVDGGSLGNDGRSRGVSAGGAMRARK